MYYVASDSASISPMPFEEVESASVSTPLHHIKANTCLKSWIDAKSGATRALEDPLACTSFSTE